MWDYYGHMGGFGFGLGWIGMLLFWGLIIWAILALVRGGTGYSCCGHQRDKNFSSKNSALEILKERYAKGEISKEEFDRMKKELE